MRTPLQSTVIIAKQLHNFLNNTKVTSQERTEALRLLSLMISQLSFIETFVEDMLNLDMMSQGVFKLESQIVDP